METPVQASKSHAGSCFLIALAPETLSNIFDFCTLPSLGVLSSTCKTLHAEVLLPLKYRSVDLSVHNRGRVLGTGHSGDIRYCWSDQFPPEFDLTDLSRKQHAFLSTVLTNPYIGKLIHKFSWTIRSYCDPDGYMPGKQTRDAVWPDTHMWDAFKAFTNIKTLDLACYQETWDWAYLRDPPSPLFPAATHIRLSGVMYPEIVSAIIHSETVSNLEHLSIDNLQDPGPYGGKWPRDSSTNQLTDINYCPNPIESHIKRLPGTMRQILPSIEHKCRVLTSFHYRKPGWIHCRAGRNSIADVQCYAELASFLSCVSETVQSFHFEQGVPEAMIPHLKAGTVEDTYGCIAPLSQKIKPMDERFIKIVLPAFMHNEWPRLKELKIVGLGSWKGRRAMDNLMKARLRKHLGVEVDIVVEDITDKPCEEYCPF